MHFSQKPFSLHGRGGRGKTPPGAGSEGLAGAVAPPGAGSEVLAGAAAPPGAGSEYLAGGGVTIFWPGQWPRRGRPRPPADAENHINNQIKPTKYYHNKH